MTGHDPEIEELRHKVHCAVVLERTPPPWKLDRKESTKLSLKYRRGKGEILIVSHAGRGWWDPTSDAKGDVFGLVQRLEPGLSFGHVRKRLREFAGLSPRFPPVDRAGGRNNPDRPVAERWAERKAVWPNSPTWRYLVRKRWLPYAIIEAASAAGVLREGPAGSAWFAHLDGHGVVSHVDVRGPTYKGSLTGGAKSLFRLPPKGPPLPRLVLAEAAIDALSVAAIESLRKDTLYTRDGRRHGPGHDRRARGAARQYRNAPRRASLQRCGRQWTGRPLRRPPPIACRKIQDPIRAASPSNRGGRLERRPARQIRNERSEGHDHARCDRHIAIPNARLRTHGKPSCDANLTVATGAKAVIGSAWTPMTSMRQSKLRQAFLGRRGPGLSFVGSGRRPVAYWLKAPQDRREIMICPRRVGDAGRFKRDVSLRL